MIPTVLPTYRRADLAFEKGEGVWLYTSDGRRLLDFGAGIAVTALGHCHPHLVAALTEQISKLWHCSNLYRIPPQERLAQRLVENSFADTVFFCNSGAEAMECCLKMARKHHSAVGRPERWRVVACHGAFHGRTLATIAAGGQEKMLAGFGPRVEGFDHVPYGSLEAMREAVTNETAAVLIEPIQGEGGMRPASADFLRGARAIADEFGLLLILDEVQCGFGRTGWLFAHERSGITPDIMGVAKGLGGGFPIGACLATEHAAVGMSVGSHGSTFGGNPLATTVGNAVLDILLADGFLTQVELKARALWRALQDIQAAYPDVIAELRGAGLMIGLKCATGIENELLLQSLLDRGLLTVPAGDNVVRVVPPLIIEMEHIERACRIIEEACVSIQNQR